MAGMPKKAGSWLRMIMIAAALMNPEITGWLNRFTTPPMFVMRSNQSVTADCRQITAVTPTYASENASACTRTASATMIAITATGPTARLGDEPSTAYSSGGTMAA